MVEMLADIASKAIFGVYVNNDQMPQLTFADILLHRDVPIDGAAGIEQCLTHNPLHGSLIVSRACREMILQKLRLCEPS